LGCRGLRAVKVGLIIMRGAELQMTFDVPAGDLSYGSRTTYMANLCPRLGGRSGGCAVVVFGIRWAADGED